MARQVCRAAAPQSVCFVSFGVTLNMAGLGLVMGFSTVLLPQLKRPESQIQIDDSVGSWIAATPGIAIIVGNFFIPSIMTKFGRKIANIISIITTIIGWVCIVLANNVAVLIIARFLQGTAMGMITTLGPVLIGEYTSPKNRGAFLMSISLSLSFGVCAIHAMGLYMDTMKSAYICIFISLIDLFIVICSPESPSWLADQGKYEECRNIFRYLRGDKEENELEKLIAASMITRKEINSVASPATLLDKLKLNIKYMKKTIKEKVFYKPIIIMLHVYTMAQWSGVNVLASYMIDYVSVMVNSEANVPLIIISVDLQRILSSCIGLWIIKKIKRRTVLFVTVGLNVLICVVVAGYAFAKHHDMLPYDNSYIGIALIHIHMFTIATGALPLGFILAGELYPLQFKGLCGGITFQAIRFMPAVHARDAGAIPAASEIKTATSRLSLRNPGILIIWSFELDLNQRPMDLQSTPFIKEPRDPHHMVLRAGFEPATYGFTVHAFH
ncbi:facilitated trehalose transporter Tret1-like [Aphomia sociella]